tara:strand:+ start:241 stop:1023 length:783 start_codon:yes stop_codon:yes gene_type:complete
MGGLYDILESYRLQNPRFTYEGLYQDPMSKLATSNPLKAIFDSGFEYRAPSFIDRFGKEGATNLQGFVPVDYDRAIDFKRLFEDRPLKATDGVKRFEGFNPRVGTITPFEPFNPKSMQSIFPTNVQTGIMSQAPKLGFDTSFGVANEEDTEQVDFLGTKPNRAQEGIAKLFEFLQRFSPVSNIARGVESLRNRFDTNRAIRADVDRDTQGTINTITSPRITNIKPTAQDTARGSMPTRTTSAPKRSFSSNYSAAQRARKF